MGLLDRAFRPQLLLGGTPRTNVVSEGASSILEYRRSKKGWMASLLGGPPKVKS
jgi:hypothetical protein